MKYSKHIFLIVILFLLDILSKLYFKGKSISFGRFLAFNYTKNTGATFGLFKEGNFIFVILTIVVIGAIIYYYKKYKKLRLGFDFILAGAFGNLINRVFYGYVIDFIDFKVWPVFNLADVFIVIGVLIVLYFGWRNK